MGTDIDGWIEYNQVKFAYDEWLPAIKLNFLYLGRDYKVFASLFGVRNTEGVRPIAEKEGVPPDVSEQVKKDALRGSAYAQSWIMWNELKTSWVREDIYWKDTFSVLEILARIHGDENVRLVVWFEDEGHGGYMFSEQEVIVCMKNTML